MCKRTGTGIVGHVGGSTSEENTASPGQREIERLQAIEKAAQECRDELSARIREAFEHKDHIYNRANALDAVDMLDAILAGRGPTS